MGVVKGGKNGKKKCEDIKKIKKQYLKTSNKCRVTFRLPKCAAPAAKSVSIVGEFNNWSESSHVMKKLKAGDFTATVDLDSGNEYQFKYLIDKAKWENDWNADKYTPTPFGGENSVVTV